MVFGSFAFVDGSGLFGSLDNGLFVVIFSLGFVHVSGVSWRLCQGGVGGGFSGGLLLDVKYFRIVFGISVGASGTMRK